VQISCLIVPLFCQPHPHRPDAYSFLLFLTHTPTTGIYTLSLHDALPISIATSLALWVSVRPRPEPPARPVARFTLVLPPSAPMSDFVGPTVALSPDGSRIVYVSSVATGSQLFSRRLDELEPAPLAGTQNARNPFFSPDG